ncbi:YihY/virulence factor BrkB family protein [Weeksellaceae bacterium TAE3-ERU29]|nr:YihY/virulence factor BrkB family protein [Weeksellaceae bacterium TAE3-ERU29]
MKKFLTKYWQIIKETAITWSDSNPFRQSAIISYYAIFSLPGLLIMIIWILGQIWGEDAVRGEVVEQFQNMMGLKSAEFVENLIQHAYLDASSSWYIQVVGIGTLVFGASTLFFQMQQTLNYIWSVEVVPQNGFIRYLIDRANSMLLIIILAFLLLLSLAATSILASFRETIEFYLGGEWTYLFRIGNIILSFVVLSVMFSIMYKRLPDVKIPWRMVWVGGFVTALLFNLGKWGLSYYFSISNPSSSFGAASTMIFIMIWINYTTLIVLFGAQFTQIYGKINGYKIKPNSYARWNDEYVLKHKDAVLNQLFQKKLEVFNRLDENIKTEFYRDPNDPEKSKEFIKELGIKNPKSFKEKVIEGFKSLMNKNK